MEKEKDTKYRILYFKGGYTKEKEGKKPRLIMSPDFILENLSDEKEEAGRLFSELRKKNKNDFRIISEAFVEVVKKVCGGCLIIHINKLDVLV